MQYQLFNHCYYRVCSCCLGCRCFTNDHCLYNESSTGHCYGFCSYDPIDYVQLSFDFNFD